MFKNVIAPIQAWLMSQGKCVGCGMPLDKGSFKKHKEGQMVTCKCRRVYIKNSKNNSYRRALLSEI
jgi:hypothetical protein